MTPSQQMLLKQTTFDGLGEGVTTGLANLASTLSKAVRAAFAAVVPLGI
jgi:hypothetical protein